MKLVSAHGGLSTLGGSSKELFVHSLVTDLALLNSCSFEKLSLEALDFIGVEIVEQVLLVSLSDLVNCIALNTLWLPIVVVGLRDVCALHLADLV